MAAPDQEANNVINGVLENGYPRWWSWVDARADYILGYNQDHVAQNHPGSDCPINGQKDRGPWNTTQPDGTVHKGTPSNVNHAVAAAESTGFRYVASDNHRYDMPDILILLLEDMIQRNGKEGMEKLRDTASKKRNLPWDVR